MVAADDNYPLSLWQDGQQGMKSMAKKNQNEQHIDWPMLLSRHPLFDSIDAKETAFLLSDEVSTKHVLDAGEIILKQGETGNSLFIVCEGKVAVKLKAPDGKEINLYTLGDGEVFGEMALFGQRPRAATLVAAEASKLLEIAGDEFLLMMQKHYEIANYLLAKLSQRLRHTDDMILSRRISGIDTSVSDLKNQLDVVIQTTDAKLAAAQSMFEQTNLRAGEAIESTNRARSDIIASADRKRTQITWLLSTATVLLGLITGAGFLSFERTLRQVEESASSAKKFATAAQESAGLAGDSESVAKTAEDAAVSATNNLKRELGKARTLVLEIDNLRLNSTLTKFMSEIKEIGYSETTPESYFKTINNELPILREKLVNFVHGEIANRLRRPHTLKMLEKSLEEYERKMSLDAIVATYYFIALIHILDNKPTFAGQYESYIREKSKDRRAFFVDLFGTGKFDPDVFTSILTAAEKAPDLQRRQENALKNLYATLQQTN